MENTELKEEVIEMPEMEAEVCYEDPELSCVSDNEYIPSQEEICDSILYNLRDNLSYLSSAQKSYLKSLCDDMMAEATPKERLYVEINELLGRIEKLDAFMRKRDEDGVRMTQKLKLTDAAVYLMNKQLELEKELNDVLVARYSIFDVKKGE